MNGGLIFLLILIFVVLASYGGWIAWSRIRAQRLGLPPPSLNPFARSASSATYPAPARGGVLGWFDTQMRRLKMRNNRSAAGAYEGTTYAGGGGGGGQQRGFEHDEAWDTRVGHEVGYEEQELGLHAPERGDYGYTGGRGIGDAVYGAPSPGFPAQDEGERGRSRTRGYEEGLHVDDASARNPFGDENAAGSLRGVSPRPLELDAQDTGYVGPKGHKKQASLDDSPTERRSEY
ncbi:hypothetical protein M011DRAFT_469491 [Sporormia fimetaria CBS 119925]|uniref:Acid phosphatase-like protein n=1 Tax=Sporormia fimetaria CBS 119925 TaxID=1340428 RepID=A0A6A6V487_9PLEO|nr:hypothetical protein M011DRAFT_469491 [Sporormia fimetaria CBS 119925]